VRGLRSHKALNDALAHDGARILDTFSNILLKPILAETLYGTVVETYYRRSDFGPRLFYPPSHVQHAPLFVAVYDYFFTGVAPPKPRALPTAPPATAAEKRRKGLLQV